MRRIVRLCLWSLLACLLVCPHAALADEGYTAIDQLDRDGVVIGVGTGDVAEFAVTDQLPHASIRYFDDKFLGYEAVAQGKIDAFAYDRRQMELSIEAGREGVRLLDGSLERKTQICVGISQVTAIDDLEGKVNRFVAELRADGTLDDMYARWVEEGNDTMPAIELPQDARQTLRVATSGIVPPYSYYVGDELAGYDIELAYRLAAWLGMRVEFSVYDYGAIFAAAESGQVDCVMADLQADDERRENFVFSEPLFEENVGIMVRAADDEVGTPDASVHAASGKGDTLLGGFLASFERTFVREDRWRLFAIGAANTLLITLASTVLGTFLGLLLYLVCRHEEGLAATITRVCLWLVQGTPLVVFLMILYYVVLASVPIDGIAVSVIAFAIVFGASAYDMLRTGVGAVGEGQYEAASALGYSERLALFRIVLPQALPHVVEPYRGAVTDLLKATAVVGYVTVQDLTKMGDIVRSRTYEAFFPLIAVTVIYFVLENLLDICLRLVARRLDPRRRSSEDVLRGLTPCPEGRALPGRVPSARSPHDAGKTSLAAQRPILRVEHLRKSFGDEAALRDVTFEVGEGDVASVIGPSGTGKSTLLRCLNLLELPTSGSVWLGDEEVTGPGCDAALVRRKMGMVFQSFNLFGHLTVVENLMLAPVDLLQKDRQEAYEEAMELLRQVGMAEKALSYPNELSGGQQQRVAIARALAMDPEVILLDEPTSALDPTMVGEVQGVIRELAMSGKTMLIVTHEMGFARSMSSRVLYVDEGVVYEQGTPEQVFGRPSRERTRRFVRRLNVLELHIGSQDYDHFRASADIERYCLRNQIPHRLTQNLLHAFEELAQLVVRSAHVAPPADVAIEHSQEQMSATLVMRYGSEPYDVTLDADPLVLSIIRGVSLELTYVAEEQEGHANRLEVRVSP